MFDSRYFVGKSCFGDYGSQNYLIFQPALQLVLVVRDFLYGHQKIASNQLTLQKTVYPKLSFNHNAKIYTLFIEMYWICLLFTS